MPPLGTWCADGIVRPVLGFHALDKLRELYPHVIDFHDYVAIRGNRVSHILMPVNDHKLENVRDEAALRC